MLLLGEQTTAEKSGSKAAGDIRALRKRMREEELVIAGTQNELAKLQVGACCCSGRCEYDETAYGKQGMWWQMLSLLRGTFTCPCEHAPCQVLLPGLVLRLCGCKWLQVQQQVHTMTCLQHAAPACLANTSAQRPAVPTHHPQVDILNTDAHNERLAEALALLDAELAEKASLLERCEGDIKRRMDEIERKTREIDTLNRKYEKMTANVEDLNTGELRSGAKQR